MQTDRGFGNGGNGGDHGLDTDNDGAVRDTVRTAIRYVAPGAKASAGPEMESTIESAVQTATVISRRQGYVELLDLDNNCILAVFIFGNQIALNRAWRDEYDPAYSARAEKEAGK